MDRISNLRDLIAQKLDRAYEGQGQYYKNGERNVTFILSHQIMKWNFVLSSAADNYLAKLAKKYFGPFAIPQAYSRTVYELTDPNGITIGKNSIVDLIPAPLLHEKRFQNRGFKSGTKISTLFPLVCRYLTFPSMEYGNSTSRFQDYCSFFYKVF